MRGTVALDFSRNILERVDKAIDIMDRYVSAYSYYVTAMYPPNAQGIFEPPNKQKAKPGFSKETEDDGQTGEN